MRGVEDAFRFQAAGVGRHRVGGPVGGELLGGHHLQRVVALGVAAHAAEHGLDAASALRRARARATARAQGGGHGVGIVAVDGLGGDAVAEAAVGEPPARRTAGAAGVEKA